MEIFDVPIGKVLSIDHPYVLRPAVHVKDLEGDIVDTQKRVFRNRQVPLCNHASCPWSGASRKVGVLFSA